MTSAKPVALQDTMKRMLREYSESFLVAIALAVCLKLWVVSSFYLPSDSMTPNLLAGDYVLGYKWQYTLSRWGISAFESPSRGDVVVVFCPSSSGEQLDSLCLKRVVGLPGDRVEIKKGALFLNGTQAVVENDSGNLLETHPFGAWHISPNEEDFGPRIVSPGHIFLLADNRTASQDSRFFGELPFSSLVASVKWVWFSRGADQKDGVEGKNSARVRWERIFLGVH